MAATVDQILRLRRMAGEVSGNSYSDADLKAYIEHYPLIDVNGRQWYLEPQSTLGTSVPGVSTVIVPNDAWIPTYDLNSAAADIWQEKAASLAPDFDFSADGSSISRSQVYEHAMQQARYYRGRRAAQSQKVTPWPPRNAATSAFDDLMDRDDHN